MINRIFKDAVIITIITASLWVATDNTTIVYVKEKQKQMIEKIADRYNPINKKRF